MYEKSRRKKKKVMRRWRVKEVGGLEGGKRDTARRHGDRLPVVDLSN